MLYLILCSFSSEMMMQCTPEVITNTSIQIKWVNRYPECFTFTVLINNRIMAKMANGSDYTIHSLNSNTTYNVCVCAMDLHGNTQRNWIHCDKITTAAAAAHGGSNSTTGGTNGPTNGPTGMYFWVMSSVFSGYGWWQAKLISKLLQWCGLSCIISQ